MRSVVLRLELPVYAGKQVVIRESPHQLVMAGARLVNARENRINHAKLGCRSDASRCNTLARSQPAVRACRVFKCSHDGRANRVNPAAVSPSAFNGQCRQFWDAIWLVEGQPAIQLGVTRG